MRWIFVDPTNHEEVAQRAARLNQIDEWWDEFCQQQDHIARLFRGEEDWDLVQWMADNLQSIDSRLMWEFGPAVKPGSSHRLVVTPEGERSLRPMVETLIERAPSGGNWEFYSRRLPESVEQAYRMAETRSGIDASETRFAIQIGEERLIHIQCYHPHCQGPEDEQHLTAALVLIENLLGEELLDECIGVIETAPLTKKGLLSMFKKAPDPNRLLEASQLKDTVTALINSIAEQLPARPCHEYVLEQAAWHNYELEPTEEADYPGREDLLLGISGRPDIFESYYSPGIFCSHRHSRHNERFCYLKIGSHETDMETRFQQRTAIEDQINSGLEPQQLGCVIGAGTGLKYTYIDLALMNVQAALPILQSAVRKIPAAPNSWLLFFDDYWANEWLGIYPTSPPPPQ